MEKVWKHTNPFYWLLQGFLNIGNDKYFGTRKTDICTNSEQDKQVICKEVEITDTRGSCAGSLACVKCDEQADCAGNYRCSSKFGNCSNECYTQRWNQVYPKKGKLNRNWANRWRKSGQGRDRYRYGYVRNWQDGNPPKNPYIKNIVNKKFGRYYYGQGAQGILHNRRIRVTNSANCQPNNARNTTYSQNGNSIDFYFLNTNMSLLMK